MTTKAPKPQPKDDASGKQRRVVYTKEFKIAAVARLRDGKQTGEALALELGIRRNQLYKWDQQLAEKGPDGSFQRGRKAAAEEREVVRLRRELARVKEENEILKKFEAYLKRAKP